MLVVDFYQRIKNKKRIIVLQGKPRVDSIAKVAKEMSDNITGTVLDNEKFNSTEMAFLVNTVKSNLETFLISRRDRLEKQLEDCNNALKELL